MASGNNVKNISLCVTEVFILCLWPARLLYVTGMLKCKPSCLMLFLPVMMAAAAICITGKSPLVDILFPLFSLLFLFLFFYSLHPFPPSIPSFCLAARKPGNQSGEISKWTGDTLAFGCLHAHSPHSHGRSSYFLQSVTVCI